MIKDAIHTVAERSDLTEQQAEAVMGEIMDGAATSAQIAAYLMGLRMKGETVEEIAGSVQAMRARATKIRVRDSQVVDTCGTGGDRAHTFNISTTAAFVVACAVCPSCQRNSVVRKNKRVRISQRTTLAHWLISKGRSR